VCSSDLIITKSFWKPLSANTIFVT
jgi:hypothetical protein